MKLLTTSDNLEKEFSRLILSYSEFYWATAWAGIGSNVFKLLVSNKRRIKKIVVGIHFYQTHPEFIKEFLNHKFVRFIKNPKGVFHPKIYLFKNNFDTNWEVIIGSANFTKSAFSDNIEACMLITNKDSNSDEIFKLAMKNIKKAWSKGETFDEENLENYRKIWNIQKSKINSLSGDYGNSNKNNKPIYKVSKITMDWEQYIVKINNEKSHSLNRRISVIDLAQELFNREIHFNKLSEEERKFIAGATNKLADVRAKDWGYFGSMKGNGVFVNKIRENDQNISFALDKIPLSGQVTKNNFDNFVYYFKKAVIGTRLEGTNNFSLTRLLAMKRPDTFICINGKNLSSLCKDFKIVREGLDIERYWYDIIERIMDSYWWQNPNPKNEEERKICEARAAFLDSLYYKK